MKCLIFFISIVCPTLMFGQTSEKELQKEIKNFLLRYSIDDVSSYQSIRFSKIDSVFEINSEGADFKDSLVNSHYDYFKHLSKEDSVLNKEEYNQSLLEFNEKLKQNKLNNQTCTALIISHTYKAKNRYNKDVYYKTRFTFDLKGKIIESSTQEDRSMKDAGS